MKSMQKKLKAQIIDTKRLKLQSEILQPASESFLKIATNFLKENTIKKVLDINCALGYETELLAKAFPLAELIAVDTKVPYIKIAKSRFQRINTRFEAVISTDIKDLIDQYGMPDLIYFRMTLMHQKEPLQFLKNIKSILPTGTKVIIAEPDLGKISSNIELQSFTKFINLILEYGHYRQENYDIGSNLVDIATQSGFLVLKLHTSQSQLKTINQKRMLDYLFRDLIPIFSEINLADEHQLYAMWNEFKEKLLYNKSSVIKYCLFSQVLLEF
jgi:trans-aconitate methyltransferase